MATPLDIITSYYPAIQQMKTGRLLSAVEQYHNHENIMPFAEIRANVWLFGGKDRDKCFHDLYKLNMESLTWTKIQTAGSLTPMDQATHSFTAISNKQIILYGGSDVNPCWILDLPSLSWREYYSPSYVDGEATENNGRCRHTGTIGTDSIIIFGGEFLPDNITLVTH